jgi:hypothetical protein
LERVQSARIWKNYGAVAALRRWYLCFFAFIEKTNAHLVHSWRSHSAIVRGMCILRQ